MSNGDLVLEIPFGREWFNRNPWMVGKSGIIIEVIEKTEGYDRLLVLWDDGKLERTTSDYVLEIEKWQSK